MRKILAFDLTGRYGLWQRKEEAAGKHRCTEDVWNREDMRNAEGRRFGAGEKLSTGRKSESAGRNGDGTVLCSAWCGG